MKFTEKYDRLLAGLISGFLLPVATGLIIWLFSSGHTGLHEYLARIVKSDIVTHVISLCVFPNIIIFLIFNRFDMLLATRGVLAATIVWAVVVFAVKFLA
jgi:hypothetical protein